MKCPPAARTAVLASLVGLVLAPVRCSLGWNLRKDPLYDAFLEKTNLIMTEEEIDIYMHLPEVSSKREFIDEFWRMRDPDPGTPESEGQMEFLRRVEFANLWFDPLGTCTGHVPARSTRKPSGWNTDRGRIYIVMGVPDEVAFKEQGIWERLNEERGDLLCRSTGWRFVRYQFAAVFDDPGLGEYDQYTVLPDHERYMKPNLSTVSVHSEAMQRAKLDWLAWEFRGWTAKPFLFKARVKRGGLEIRIPIDRLSFESVEDRLRGRLETEVHVYQAHKRKETLRDTRTLDYSEQEVLGMRAVEFLVPFAPKSRGGHLFDIIVTFETPQSRAKYRTYVKKRL